MHPARNYKIVHFLPGRVRFEVPGLLRNKNLAKELAEGIKEFQGVCFVFASPATGRVLIISRKSHVLSREILSFIEETSLRVENHLLSSKNSPAKRRNIKMVLRGIVEPEDIPFRRQILNVILGGGVLAFLTVKRIIWGVSPLARSSRLFNLATATTLILGYPVLRSGLQQFSLGGRINHDLVISGLALGTLILRESIPGLLVVWLVHLTAFGQSLIWNKINRLVDPGIIERQTVARQGHSVENKGKNKGLITGWSVMGNNYAEKFVPLSLGLSALTGLIAGQWSRTLAMLLAACPAPAGLAYSTAVTTAMVKLARKGILVKNAQALYLLTKVDTLYVDPVIFEQEREVEQIIAELQMRGVKHIGFLNEEGLEEVYFRVAEVNLDKDRGGLASEKAGIIAVLLRQGRIIAVLFRDVSNAPAPGAAGLKIVAGCPDGLPDIDIMFPNSFSLEALSVLYRFAFYTGGRIRQNLNLVRGANALGLALGATGLCSPVSAPLFNNLISLTAAFNSLYLLGKDRKEKPKYTGVSSRTKATRGNTLPVVCNRQLAAGMEAQIHLDTGPEVNPLKYQWPSLPAGLVLELLNTGMEQGLPGLEVRQRLLLYGYNRIDGTPDPGFFARIAGQFKNFLVQALLGSTTVCFLLGQVADAFAIMSILFINTLLGALQEQKAQNAIAALKEMAPPVARVIRDGSIQRIPAFELVPGDIILLEQGDVVPVDVRLLTAGNLEVDEAALTGESIPVAKNTDVLSNCLSLLDCSNMAFMGTTVASGRATAVAVATGMNTEIGNIAGLLKDDPAKKTPLQERLASIGKYALAGSLGASGLLILAGILRGSSLFNMFLTGVSLAVAAIPEGLPAVVTMALAVGIQRMARAKAVIVALPAVETIGSTTVICTDKTGTLTLNEQTVQVIYSDGRWWEIKEGVLGNSGFCIPEKLVELGGNNGPRFTLAASTLCSNASLVPAPPDRINRKGTGGSFFNCGGERWRIEGDPTEGAILRAAALYGINPAELSLLYRRILEIPFDSRRFLMTVVYADNQGGRMAYIKGAPGAVLKLCDKVWQGGRVLPLGPGRREELLLICEKLAARPMRVLAVACRGVEEGFSSETGNLEKNLVFIGIVGMTDPPRPEVPAALKRCRQAGIKVVMLTGDHRNTALAIARRLDLLDSCDMSLTGQEIEMMGDGQLREAVKKVRVFARLLPEHKKRIVRAFKQQGELVAVVGDGVNDAPAVKDADIGVAMGEKGTDVTRQSAEIILLDDNFSTIVTAIEQGRGVFDNMRKSVRYLLATNAGEVFLMLTAVILGMPLPLLPIQLLWLNLLGDGLPALALAADLPAKDLMRRPPREKTVDFMDNSLKKKVLSRGLAIGLTTLGAFRWGLFSNNLDKARTLALATITTGQLLHAVDCRWDTEGKERQNNNYLNGSIALSAILMFGAIYLPAGRFIFKTSPLGLMDWGVALLGTGLSAGLDKAIRGLLPGLADKKREEYGVSGHTAGSGVVPDLS